MTHGEGVDEHARARKLTRDVIYSLASFAVLALSGIVINLVIARTRDAAALGVFNQAYAVYIVVSQVATLGLHYSVLRHAALHDADAVQRGRLLWTAAASALGLGIFAGAAVYVGAGLFAHAFDSQVAGRAIGWSAAGLTLFSFNKVLLSYLNGLRLMRAHSILQAMRYLVIMGCVSAVAASDLPVEMMTAAFFVAEALTSLGTLWYLARYGHAGTFRFDRDWLGAHLRFGIRGLAAGMFAEFNSRVDVLLIGVFLPDSDVGVYSFAAMMVDGVYHILAMIRLNFNPMLVAVLRDKDQAMAVRLRARSRLLLVPAAAVMAAAAIGALWVLATYIAPDKGLLGGMPSLAILMAGLVAISAFVPFDNLMLVSGHPGYQTIQQMVTVVANAAMAVALLPLLGIAGAAVGTATSYLAGVGMLLWLSPRVVGWNLLTNRFKS